MRHVIQYSPTAVCCDSARSTCKAHTARFSQHASRQARLRRLPRARAQRSLPPSASMMSRWCSSFQLSAKCTWRMAKAVCVSLAQSGWGRPRLLRAAARVSAVMARSARPARVASQAGPHGKQTAWLRARKAAREGGAQSQALASPVPSGSRCGATIRASRTGAAPTGTLRCGRGAHAARVSAAATTAPASPVRRILAPLAARPPRTKVGHARHGLQRVEASIRLIRPEGIHKADDLVHKCCVDGLLYGDDAAGRAGAGRR